jgi:hypothetical protein
VPPTDFGIDEFGYRLEASVEMDEFLPTKI